MENTASILVYNRWWSHMPWCYKKINSDVNNTSISFSRHYNGFYCIRHNFSRAWNIVCTFGTDPLNTCLMSWICYRDVLSALLMMKRTHIISNLVSHDVIRRLLSHPHDHICSPSIRTDLAIHWRIPIESNQKANEILYMPHDFPLEWSANCVPVLL